MSSNIVVIGSSNIDLIMQVKQLPKPGETVTGGIFNQMHGGKGANQAVGAARSGAEVTFISCLGTDDFAPAMVKSFQEDNIDSSFIFQEQGFATGTALIMIDEKGENCISVAPGANFVLSKKHIDQAIAAIENAELVLLQCEILPETIHYCIEKSRELGKKIVLNLAPAYPLPDVFLRELDILIVNESEAELLSKLPVNTMEEAKVASLKLKQMVRGAVILTLGSKGSLVSTDKEQYTVPAFEVKAVDTTAAGDVYCGSLATALVEGKTLREAVRFASAAAAIAVTRLGAQVSAPSRSEIEALLA